MSFKKHGRKFKFDTDEFRIAIASDWHVGSEACKLDLIKRFIERVKKDKHCYLIGLGDLLECAIYGSKGLVHEQKFMMNEQVKIVKDLLLEVKDRILFLLSGNHTFRVVKATTLDVMKWLCDDIGVSYEGSEYHFALQCKHGNILPCFGGHGSGGGGTGGAKMNRLQAMHFRSPMAQIILSGHTHDVADSEMPIYYLNHKSQLVEKIQYFICGWSALSSDCGYAARAYFKPLSNGQKVIHVKFDRTKEDFKIEVEKFR